MPKARKAGGGARRAGGPRRNQSYLEANMTEEDMRKTLLLTIKVQAAMRRLPWRLPWRLLRRQRERLCKPIKRTPVE